MQRERDILAASARMEATDRLYGALADIGLPGAIIAVEIALILMRQCRQEQERLHAQGFKGEVFQFSDAELSKLETAKGKLPAATPDHLGSARLYAEELLTRFRADEAALVSFNVARPLAAHMPRHNSRGEK